MLAINLPLRYTSYPAMPVPPDGALQKSVTDVLEVAAPVRFVGAGTLALLTRPTFVTKTIAPNARIKNKEINRTRDPVAIFFIHPDCIINECSIVGGKKVRPL